MQQTSLTGADFSEREIAQVVEQAKIARARFLCEPHGRGWKAIGLSTLACILALLVVVGARSPRQQVLENTALIEQLATRLAQAQTIAPDTAAEISQLLRRPDYDCRRFMCDARLEKRNLAARSKLQMILARATLQADAADR
jgi:hypothetical protein